jgi:soluble lytic murein transglycosylase-like protein
MPANPHDLVAARDLAGPAVRRPFLVALALTLMTAAVQWTPPVPLPPPAPVRPLAILPAVTAPRVRLPVDSAALEREVVARFQHHPLAQLLMRRTRQQAIADRNARAIVKEANYLDVSPSLLTGVLLTENAPLDVDARSSQGALGLMQVMHFHAGEYDCDSDDLLQVESNICHGARVFGEYLKRTGDVRRALLRYNGCVAGTVTPRCGRYPTKVLRTARLVRRQLLQYEPISEPQ